MSLKGIRVLEFAGLAPAPFCGMLLADFGATVTRIDKIDSFDVDLLSRGKKSIALNLKKPDGIKIVKQLSENCDVIIEPFRIGVMEKLGLGPTVLLKQNPRLIYARLNGFGHLSDYETQPGHDINFVALSGLLGHLHWSRNSTPNPPLNLLGDFAGGGLMCAFGIVAALLRRTVSNRGQIVDCSMTNSCAYLSTWIFRSFRSQLLWPTANRPGTNLLDGGRHFYNVYETNDAKFMAVGAIEPQFYRNFIATLNLEQDPLFDNQFDAETESLKVEKIRSKFAEKSQSDWCSIFDRADACVTPVLDYQQANARFGGSMFDKNGDPKPSPSLSESPAQSAGGHDSQPLLGQHTNEILRELNYSQPQIEHFHNQNIIFDYFAQKKSKL